tara:strand:- start:3702 stop:4094 length:393 start_codon:yes stop_codon:yes gene_type:complete
MNIYNYLLDEDSDDEKLTIKRVRYKHTSETFDIAFKTATKIFKNELLKVKKSEILDFTDEPIIVLPGDIKTPIRYNKKYRKYLEINFRKDIFLQNYDFIEELNRNLLQFNLKISFNKIEKYIWEKIITRL